MALLHNRVSRKELKEKMQADPTPRTTISFYRYLPIADPVYFRDEMYKSMKSLQVFGRIYIASEGINAQISVPTDRLELLRNYLEATPGLSGLRLNIAVAEPEHSFFVLDVKLRKKIVADGIEDPDFSMEKKGKYVNAVQFNEMTNDPNTIVIDMRNHYEYEVGHFKDALEIPSDTFREQLPMAADMMQEHKNKNIIMYCTGGIRCEKASAYLLHQGFENVYHLEGGIIHYVNQVKEGGLPNKFIGKNFVFDQRLGERVTEDVIAVCHQCGTPCDTHTNCVNDACHLLFIQCEGCKQKWNGCCGKDCLDFIQLPEAEQRERRKGMDLGRNIFNKARDRKQHP
ncbi:MAG: rhodanese-related sulfurtransferase [Bacteroidetes bacterium]|nr:rhodanese-related sulfurtransferase [Bacteroidota bacterium]